MRTSLLFALIAAITVITVPAHAISIVSPGKANPGWIHLKGGGKVKDVLTGEYGCTKDLKNCAGSTSASIVAVNGRRVTLHFANGLEYDYPFKP